MDIEETLAAFAPVDHMRVGTGKSGRST